MNTFCNHPMVQFGFAIFDTHGNTNEIIGFSA